MKFLGNIDKKTLEEVKKRLQRVKASSFVSFIGKLGFFYPRIIWLHISNADELQKAVDGILEPLFRKESRFMGHLTIARVTSVADWRKFKDELSKTKLKEIRFPVKSFRLKKSVLTSKGPAYETLEEYFLN